MMDAFRLNPRPSAHHGRDELPERPPRPQRLQSRCRDLGLAALRPPTCHLFPSDTWFRSSKHEPVNIGVRHLDRKLEPFGPIASGASLAYSALSPASGLWPAVMPNLVSNLAHDLRQYLFDDFGHRRSQPVTIRVPRRLLNLSIIALVFGEPCYSP
jgi:hypothetical protein